MKSLEDRVEMRISQVETVCIRQKCETLKSREGLCTHDFFEGQRNIRQRKGSEEGEPSWMLGAEE